ncbi:MAG TPA: fumarylacetoacetate hydrolase family protein [Dermatophilaceae bacterium]|nr:fumarylacetoacetate hydrolase family protein [Dermatophilaceae bacterium]
MQPSLNHFLSLGRPAWAAARSWLTEVLSNPAHRDGIEPFLIPLSDGKHLPIGYHGRSGTVVVSGTEILRPMGQRKVPTDPAPVFGPSSKLDIEAKLAFIVGGATELGRPLGIDDAADHLFGVALLSDWSARDLQAWEYVPLGPFLGKSFGASLGVWVVPMEALVAARVPQPQQDPEPLPYLRASGETGSGAGPFGLDLPLEVRLNGTLVSSPTYAGMYWSPDQRLAHQTVNGASLRDGDLFASGTISGAGRNTRGSLMQLTWNGQEPLTLDDGLTRAFLQDGDTVTVTGWLRARMARA